MWLRGVQLGSRQLFGQVAQHDFIQMLHGQEGEVPEVRAQTVPQRLFASEFLPDGAEQGTAQLLGLIDQEQSKGHQYREHDRQILPVAMPEIVLKLVTLILERVESFVLNLPTSPTAASQMRCIAYR